jgi:hypothetical protein
MAGRAHRDDELKRKCGSKWFAVQTWMASLPFSSAINEPGLSMMAFSFFN